MTEPEQWAVELFIAAVAQWWRQTDRSDYGPAALTIQRAFEERERKLREALETLEASLTRDMGAGYAGVALCQALKETPDAQ